MSSTKIVLRLVLVLATVALCACERGGGEGGGSAPAERAPAAPEAGADVGSLLTNGSFEEWPGDDGQLPVGWQLVEWEAEHQVKPATAAEDVHDGKHSLRFQAHEQRVVSITNAVPISDDVHADLRGSPVTAGVWAKAGEPGTAFMSIRHDGRESQIIDHPGDGEWHFLVVTETVAEAATNVGIRIGNRKQDGTTVAFFDGAMMVAGAQIPPVVNK